MMDSEHVRKPELLQDDNGDSAGDFDLPPFLRDRNY